MSEVMSSKGDVLVRLDARDAQIRLEQAQAQVEQQRKAVALPKPELIRRLRVFGRRRFGLA